jgi:EAL domain-containing protein (putative c-di-GMP-specific phosphodiesterase class I)
VEDDPIVLRATARMLEECGCVVTGCLSAEQALTRLVDETFDVMLSDIQMPGISGLRLLRSVRERDLDLPVILMTGSPDVPTAVAAVEYGALRYLIKPLDPALLDAALEQALSAGRMARLQRQYHDHFRHGHVALADRAGLDAALDRALASTWMAFQPIVLAGSSELFAYEALLRSSERNLSRPAEILEAAGLAERLHEVGRTVRASVAAMIEGAREDCLFFVNVHPKDLLDPTLYRPNEPLGQVAPRVVLEITERASLDSLADAPARVARLRELGYRIALDDLGAGYAGLASFTVLEPEFVKLDMSLIRGVAQSPTKKKIVGSMVQLCHDLGQRIIAEGVETLEERQALESLGCDLMQGFLFGAPAKSFDERVVATAVEG